MSSTGSRLLALAVLTTAVAGGGLVALGTVCDLDGTCGDDVDQSYTLGEGAHEEVLSYGLTVEDGSVVAVSANWTSNPPAPTGGDSGDRDTFLLTVDKNGIPLETGIRHVLPGGTGAVTWNSGATETAADPGDEFRFTFYTVAGTEEVPLHRTHVTITR